MSTTRDSQIANFTLLKDARLYLARQNLNRLSIRRYMHKRKFSHIFLKKVLQKQIPSNKQIRWIHRQPWGANRLVYCHQISRSFNFFVVSCLYISVCVFMYRHVQRWSTQSLSNHNFARYFDVICFGPLAQN